MKYLVTIDREEWTSARRWEFWKRAWRIERQRQFQKIHGIGRTVFEVERSSGKCCALFELPQLLDERILRDCWNEQSAWTKSITRGLRAITPLHDGTLIVNDIFGIYHTTLSGEVINYVTSAAFADVHCATPNADNTRLIVANTGTEELLEVDWNGTLHRRIHLPDLFELPVSPRLTKEYERHADRRAMRLDHTRELFHVNWAEWVSDGAMILVSCHQPGIVALIDVSSAAPRVAKQWGYFPHCHGPSLVGDATLLVAVSKTDEVIEFDLATGRRRWTATNMGYSKRVLPIDRDCALACDCNGKRLVELSRTDGSVSWQCHLPGLPFAAAVFAQDL